jgi:hypothetical protein
VDEPGSSLVVVEAGNKKLVQTRLDAMAVSEKLELAVVQGVLIKA